MARITDVVHYLLIRCDTIVPTLINEFNSYQNAIAKRDELKKENPTADYKICEYTVIIPTPK